jgi:hypothetical protein
MTDEMVTKWGMQLGIPLVYFIFNVYYLGFSQRI